MHRVLPIAMILLLWTSSATSVLNAPITTGSGLNFSCDVNTRQCECSGVPEGADCQAMLKNCKNKDWEVCYSDTNKCYCTMASTKAPVRKFSPVSPPTTLSY